MRLLHSRLKTFQEFTDSKLPPYAIISHRWTEEEVTYQSFLCGQEAFQRGECTGYGWEKIAKACQVAAHGASKWAREPMELEWVWIDTICIDKTSSAELSEAINSMYAWYRKAQVCYVFLPDVHEAQMSVAGDGGSDEQLRPDIHCLPGYHCDFDARQFQLSTWFTRAWTLQELLAPQEVIFLNSAFEAFGDREVLSTMVSAITDIPEKQLRRSFRAYSDVSIAARFRWASRREATRVEDLAYSLLGIVDVNMPLLYGEGDRAFVRLQKEIINQSADESIFAWRCAEEGEHEGENENKQPALLAPGPRYFSDAQAYRPLGYFRRQHYQVTNKGVRFVLTLPSTMLTDARQYSTILVPLSLEVQQKGNGSPRRMAIPCLRIFIQKPGTHALLSGRVKYLNGHRLGLETVEVEDHADWLAQMVSAARRFQDMPGHKWDAMADVGGDGYEEIPVYVAIDEQSLFTIHQR